MISPSRRPSPLAWLQSTWALAPGREAYGEPPPPSGGWYRTFCGT
ncbi:MAG: hypothetical protein ACKN89_12070 [Cyanobium sp.]